jgi:hypothetical protein
VVVPLVLSLAVAATEPSTFSSTTSAGADVVSGSENEPLWGIKIHGFVSQGYIKSTDNNFLGNSKRGTFEFTEVGLNFTKSLTDRLSTGIQFFAQRLNSAGDFSAKFDWFYLDYRFADWFGIRVGRVKLPFGLYNEFSDIDSARVAILLPSSIYPVQNRDFLLAQTGGELYGFVPIDALGAVEYRAYAGTIIFNEPSTTDQFQNIGVDVRYLFGGRILWETPVDGLRLAVSAQRLWLDFSFTLPQMPALGKVEGNIPASLYVASAEYAVNALVLATEYSRWVVDVTSNQAALFPTGRTISDRFYALATYQVSSWLHPGAYYSVFFPRGFDNRSGASGSQQDVALTLRFDLNNFWLLKLEGHYMHGTAILDSAQNGGVSLDALERNWVVFLARTTLHF